MRYQSQQFRHHLGALSKEEKLKILKTKEPRRIGPIEPKPEKILIICPRCSALYYDEKWYQQNELFNHLKKKQELLRKQFDQWLQEKLKKAAQRPCPACSQRKDWCEGVLTLTNLTPPLKKEILNLVKNVNQRALTRDIQDRVIKIEDKGAQVIIYTSENQLAVSLGKQIHRSHKGGKLVIKFSHAEDAIRVFWAAPSPKP